MSILKDWDYAAHAKQVGHRLRVARLALGLTEQAAAVVFRVSLRTYRKYELSGPPPRSVMWGDGFCRRYGVCIDWLVSGEGFGLKPHLVRSKGRIAILPTDSAHRRNGEIAWQIAACLPRGRPDALAALAMARCMVEMFPQWGDDRSQIVQFPSSPAA